MAEYKVEFREQNTTVVMDLRKDGVLVASSSGDSKKVAVSNALRVLQSRIDVGKEAEGAKGYLDAYQEGIPE